MTQGIKRGNKPSTNPPAVRARMRARVKKIGTTEADLIEHVKLLPHYKPVEEWDMEELARGRPRGKDNSFHGPRPAWLTPTVRTEAQRRLKELAGEMLASQVGNAIKVMAELMADDSVNEFGDPVVPPKVKIDAAKFIVEQVMGKAKQRIDVETGPGIRELLGQFMVNPNGKPDYNPRIINEEGDDVT